MSIQLDSTFDKYQQLIEHIRPPKQQIDCSQALEILNARDALQVALEDPKLVTLDLQQQVFESDAVLRANAEKIVDAVNGKTNYLFTHWRENIQRSDRAWWWQLDTIESPPSQDHWVWNGLRILVWGMTISLVVNIFSRFGGAGGVGFFDPSSLIAQVITGFLSRGGTLPKVEPLLLKSLKVPPHKRQEKKLPLAITALILIFVISEFAIPLCSEAYNKAGLENFKVGDLTAAEKDYKRAISLNGKNKFSHYNLGSVYEGQLEIDLAKKQYQIAVAEKYIPAYNNLGRLYIQEKKYSQAAMLLVTGLEQAEEKNSPPEIKYSFYKNLGWARLNQNRGREAKEVLQKAVNILGNPEENKYINNPGAAHCLLAQTLEQLKESTALGEWEKCRQLKPPPPPLFDPDEDTWHYLAKQKLKQSQLPKVNNVKPAKVK
jgi:tetratricopeptide (TPR) repeat protein